MSTAAAQYPIMCWEWEGGAIPADREAADEGTAVEKNAQLGLAPARSHGDAANHPGSGNVVGRSVNGAAAAT
jgi:hypothetical protein